MCVVLSKWEGESRGKSPLQPHTDYRSVGVISLLVEYLGLESFPFKYDSIELITLKIYF